MPKNAFSTGCQPCDTYKPALDNVASGPGIPNVHDCSGPYPHVADVDCCRGCVSHCINCHSDHHCMGWQTCPRPKDTHPVPPETVVRSSTARRAIKTIATKVGRHTIKR